MSTSRRGFLQSAGLTSVGAVGAGLIPTSVAAAVGPGASATSSGTVPFYGPHQAGIATPAQDYLQFVALDMVSDSVSDLRRLLVQWSAAAALMSVGKPIGSMQTGAKPPVDTGEAVGLPPARLTVTFGFGPTLFTDKGKDRFGLARKRPVPLVDLPSFAGDALQAGISGGDLGIQVCADDQAVAFHAAHELIKLAHPVAEPRWLLTGFGHTGNSRHQAIPRNLMGFQDGTANIMAEDSALLNNFVWAREPVSPAWMRGGSYMVARRIRIHLKEWDSTSLAGQENTIGRKKLSGRVLPILPTFSHVLLASPGQNNGQQMLRRGYGFSDGIDPAGGAPAAGLMFICYQRDPRLQFILIQGQLANFDTLGKFIRHIGSAIFACPPGASRGGFVGEGLLG